MIAILDYKIGNLGSIYNMVKKTTNHVLITNNYKEIKKADKLILPGVGAFDSGVKVLSKYGLDEMILEHAITKEKPILGICLGMQILGRKSEEGEMKGLSLIPFDCIKFNLESNKFKIPNMGWNYVKNAQENELMPKNKCEKQKFYFAHSYHVVCDNIENILMESWYGYSFTVAVCKNNIYGVQFHPEKSHKFGLHLLENFVNRC